MTSSPEHSATRDRAKELKDRNRGSIDQWLFSGYDDKAYESPRPKQRIHTDEAAEYSARNQGSLRDVMSMSETDGDDSPKHKNTPRKTGPPVQRCPTEECRKNMDRHGGQGMKGVFGSDEGQKNGEPESPTKSRNRPEAQANADRHKGSMNMAFGCNDVADGTGAQNKQRVKPEGSHYAERNKGSLTQQMYNYGNGERTPPPARRIKGEALANARLAGGTGIMDVFHHDNE